MDKYIFWFKSLLLEGLQDSEYDLAIFALVVLWLWGVCDTFDNIDGNFNAYQQVIMIYGLNSNK